ncbi:MAG TPA: STAS/SEC14 domain-containing protein [Solirubrobacterales bacterium]
MIDPIEDMPARSIGFRITGEVTDADYVDVLVPALKAAAGSGEVRLLLVGEEGFDLGSLRARFETARKDPDLDIGNKKDWRRVAVVADVNFFIRRLFPGLAKVVPVDVKLFDAKDEAEARSWIAG